MPPLQTLLLESDGPTFKSLLFHLLPCDLGPVTEVLPKSVLSFLNWNHNNTSLTQLWGLIEMHSATWISNTIIY